MGLFLSPWFIIGAVAVILPLFLFMTTVSLNNQRAQTTRLLIEKGAALIRSFEAGARTGFGMQQWGMFQLEKLLVETAQQPDIDHIIVTDNRGVIIADSDPSMIGETYGRDLDLVKISRSISLNWRQVQNPTGSDTFEVYRKFAPMRVPFPRENDRFLHGMGIGPGASSPGRNSDERNLVIFIGMNMGPIEAAQRGDREHTIWMAVVMLLIGSAGMIALLVVQAYRNTRASLVRMRVLSDTLLANMSIGLVAVDPEEKITTMNQAAQELLHVNISGTEGMSVGSVLPQPCVEMIDKLKGDISLISEEVACPIAGKLTTMEIIAAVLKSQESENLGHVLLLRDLTEIKRLRAEMARSQRLAAIGSLAAGMAHEIRNPLSSIKGFATYFRERYGDHPEDVKTADIMIGEVDRLNKVVSQLLEFARPVEIHRKPVSLMRTIQSTLRVIEAQTSGRIEIHIDIPRNLPEVRIDPDRFHQVLLNLFLNALAAMPDKGVLAIKGALSDDGMLNIEVSDTGKGIPGQDIERIFDPYFTSKSSGTGLGLTVVQKIVEAHGGIIRVTSHPGRGTTMTIILPADNQITQGTPVTTAGKIDEI